MIDNWGDRNPVDPRDEGYHRCYCGAWVASPHIECRALNGATK